MRNQIESKVWALTLLARRFVLLIGLVGSGYLSAAEPLMPAKDFAADAKVAAANNQPIAVLLVYRGVKSGQMLKEEALLPNLLSGAFDGKALFREIVVNDGQTIVDFYGEPMPAKDYQALFNVTNLPVMLLVDAEGNLLTEPLIAGSYEFYGHALKRKLNQAFEQLGNPYRFD